MITLFNYQIQYNLDKNTRLIIRILLLHNFYTINFEVFHYL